MWFDSIKPGSAVTITVNFLLSTPLRVCVRVQPSQQWCCAKTDQQLTLVVVLTTLINTYTPALTNGVKIPSTIHVGRAFLKGRLPISHHRWWPYQQLIYTLLSLQNYSQESFGERQMSKNKHTKSCTGLKKTTQPDKYRPISYRLFTRQFTLFQFKMICKPSGKPICALPCLRSFPNITFRMVIGVCLTDDGPVWSCHEGLLMIAASYTSLLHTADAVMSFSLSANLFPHSRQWYTLWKMMCWATLHVLLFHPKLFGEV